MKSVTKGFDTQLDQSRRVAEASAKPILSVAIRNHGPGTAIIREIKFVRGKDEASQVCVLLNVERYPEIQWNEDTEFVCPCYIDGKSVEDAFRVDAEHLRGGGVQRNGLKK